MASDRELTDEEIFGIIDQAAEMGIPRITFFGGEPLLRESICGFISHADSAGMMTRINTNGAALTEKLVRSLKKAGLTHCDVSIDSADPGTHDRLRGLPGLFEKATQGIRLLRKEGILCQTVTYAARRNVIDGLRQIALLSRNLNASALSIVFPVATGCWFESYDELLDEDERKRVVELADGHFVHVELPTSRCRCSVVKKKSLYVSPVGNVTPCPFVPWACGSIRETLLRDLYESFVSIYQGDCQGNCVMNNPDTRNELQKAIEIVAGSTRQTILGK